MKAGKKGSKMAGKEDKLVNTTVIFIPPTKGGLLSSLMREIDKKMSGITRFKVNIQELEASSWQNVLR